VTTDGLLANQYNELEQIQSGVNGC
jgi:hypothetical protein